MRSFCLFVLTAIIMVFIHSCYSQTQSQTQTPTQTLPSQNVVQTSSCGSSSRGLQDNPVAAKYGVKAFPWANNIKWNCVYNIKDFPAPTVDASFNAARDAAAKSGGVVYFPAGTYNFADSIYLKNGVVIRGEIPKVNDAKSNSYSSPSKLVFPQYKPSFTGSGTPNNTAFKKILTTNPNTDSNIGVVNLDINRAAIDFSANDSDKNTNQDIVIFGVRSNNVASAESRVPTDFQNPWQRYSNRFAANIEIKAFKNVLIANNRLNDAVTDNFDQPNYIVRANRGNSTVTYSSGDRARFNYTDHYGISLNRYSSPQELPNDPNRFPNFFRKGLVIQDNWVYHTMRVAIHATGDGLIVKNNQVRDNKNKQAWLDPTGTKQPQNAATFENRAIDWSGWNVTIDGNDYEVYRHQIMPDAAYYSVDGEGILIQECCGGTSVSGVKITNNKGNAYIGIYKIPLVKDVEISLNNILNNEISASSILAIADRNPDPGTKKPNPGRMDNVRIVNNQVANISVQAGLGGSGNVIEGNFGSGNLSYSCGMKVNRNNGFTVKPCIK